MPRLSVVIPTLNAGALLDRTLSALSEGVEAGLVGEIVVSDGGSSDDTLLRARKAGARVVSGAASRGGQLRRGAEAASGDWLLFLHADSVPLRGWTGPVIRHLDGGGGAAAFRLCFDAKGPAAAFVAGWANLRTRLFGLAWGDQGLLVSRSDYDASGGYPDQPLMEDVALSLRLRPVLLRAQVVTSAARYQAEGWLRRGARNFWLLARYAAGARPETLARDYRRR